MRPSEAIIPLLPIDVPVDLDNCAREPIHIPGRVQPRGILLAVREGDLMVVQVSDNIGSMLGVDVVAALGHPLSDVLGVATASAVERVVRSFGSLEERNPLNAVVEVHGRPVVFDVILHRGADGAVLVEMEPAEGRRPFEFPNTYLAVRTAVSELNQASTLVDLYGITARVVRHLTGFDRVMVYRYDHEFNGEVVAEEKREDLESFLGLHYPASDIPAQARALYETNWIRLISDVDYRPAVIVPNLHPTTGQPLDLTLSTLRSVSPIHLEYLHNMGVRASMSISLLRHGVLWGLIACHHYSGPHAPPYGVRTAAEFLGSTLSLRLVDRAEEDELRTLLAARAVLAKLTAATFDETEPMVDALLGNPSLLDLVSADGVAVTTEGLTATRGVVPDEDAVNAIVTWAASVGDELVTTDSLSASAAQLGVPPETASGVLVLLLPEDQSIVWFRGENRHTVDWGGDPQSKAIQVIEDAGVRLSPRKSFERWQQVVRLRSQPWTDEQRQLAAELRTHIVEALYARSQRGLRLAETLQRSLLPTSRPIVPGWTITARYEIPLGAQVGGDWYDAFRLDDDTIVIVVGDVAGHGIGAAGTMAQLRNALRAYVLEAGSPGAALTQINAFIVRLLPTTMATAVVAYVNIHTGHVQAASAGHLSPYVVVDGAPAVMAPLKTSRILGIPGAVYADTDFMLPPGGAMILYTDGLIERRTEILDISLDRFASTLASLGSRTDAEEIFATAIQPGGDDDATVVVVNRLRSSDPG